jgi:hypothetical protein
MRGGEKRNEMDKTGNEIKKRIMIMKKARLNSVPFSY